MQTEKVEVLALELSFGCLRKGNCERNFVCINPKDLLNNVCPHLVATDKLKASFKKMEDEGEKLG